MRRSISIFGSTGSIGCNTVDLIMAQGGADAYDVKTLSGSANIQLLASQAIALRADLAVTADGTRLDELRDALSGSNVKCTAGPDALADAAQQPVDWAMSAIVGSAGLVPTLNIAKNAGILALANKESLVCAGNLVKSTCEKSGCILLPVDSEHSALFQSLSGSKSHEISRLILTASGGPFREWSLDQMAKATLEQAVAHPNWDMGQRISIDSATMFNKALEVIEAKELFDVSADMIEVVIHPQSIIHSMIEFKDASTIAQLGMPDMRGAIGFALNWPERLDLPIERLDLTEISRLDFTKPDEIRFPALIMARRVMQIGGLSGAVFNAAKEIALDRFIAKDIGFLQMSQLVEHVLDCMQIEAASGNSNDGIDAVLAIDGLARKAGQRWKPV